MNVKFALLWIRFETLVARREGMRADNAWRELRGGLPAHDGEDFEQIALAMERIAEQIEEVARQANQRPRATPDEQGATASAGGG